MEKNELNNLENLINNEDFSTLLENPINQSLPSEVYDLVQSHLKEYFGIIDLKVTHNHPDIQIHSGATKASL